MKKLQLYVLRSILAAFLPAFMALTLLMTVGLCMQLLHEGLDVVRLSGLLPPMLAYCVPVVLPSAFLTAVILAFGRLSADNELTAMRAAGISLGRVVHPVLLAAVGLSLVAAYFQFESVPRARAAMKALRYRALKQILLDRVALSWRRQLSFPPAHIQYEDFEEGEMKEVVVLEIEADRPRTIITAESSTVRPDPEHSEIIVFELSDCIITRFDMQEAAETRTLRSEKVIYSVRVAPEEEDIYKHRKHLPLVPLLQERRRLKEAMAGRTLFDDPEEVQRDALEERKRLGVWLGKIERALESSRQKHAKYAVQEPRRERELIERNRKLIAEAEQRVQDLQKQQAEVAAELEAMQGEAEDLEREVELRQRQRDLLAWIEEARQDIRPLQAELAEAEAALQEAADRAAQLEVEIRELAQRREDLLKERRELNHIVNQASDQHELDSISVRIHKRLTQAASVFVFALVGIPLGILASRRHVMVAFGISFAIVLLVFYPFLILGQMAAEAGAMPVAPAMWAGNAFTFVIGAALTARVLTR
jgi:lipopolysaccharide export LptBFGC system permease protein LptF